MNDFVEQCRREWARLGVPVAVANEMAADLSADLEEAERDGVSAEEVIGRGAFDAAAFAHSWAAERGVIPPTPPPSTPSAPPGQRRWTPFAIAGGVALGLVGALLAIVATSQLALGRTVRAVAPAQLHLPGNPVIPPDVGRRLALPEHVALHAGVGPWVLAALALVVVAAVAAGVAFGAALWSRRLRAGV